MSNYVMNLIWADESGRLNGTEKAILIKLADHGNDEGLNIHPSIEQLVRSTGFGKTTVVKTLKSLSDKGYLIRLTHGKNKKEASTYQILLKRIVDKSKESRKVIHTRRCLINVHCTVTRYSELIKKYAHCTVTRYSHCTVTRSSTLIYNNINTKHHLGAKTLSVDKLAIPLIFSHEEMERVMDAKQTFLTTIENIERHRRLVEETILKPLQLAA